MKPVLFLLVIALASQVATAAAAAGEESERYEGGIALGPVWEQDPGAGRDLQGYHLAFAAFSEGRNSAFFGSWYFEWKESRQQEIAEFGVAAAYPYFRMRRFGLGPRYRLAVQERAEPPHRGTDGVLGVGFEFGVRLGGSVHLAAVADRSFGFETGTRNAYSLSLRIMLWED